MGTQYIFRKYQNLFTKLASVLLFGCTLFASSAQAIGDAGWFALGNSTSGKVNATLWNGTDLYIGGSFSTVYNPDGTPIAVNNVAKWNGSTNTWEALGTGVTCIYEVCGLSSNQVSVRALEWDGTNLYVSGTFSHADGKPANNLAIWNSTNPVPSERWQALDPDLVFKPNTGALAWDGTYLYVATLYGLSCTDPTGPDSTCRNIARWHVSDRAWSSLDYGLNANVQALVWDDSSNTLYAGGYFTADYDHVDTDDPADGVPDTWLENQVLNRVAKWNGTNWSPLNNGLDYGLNGWVETLALDGNNLYAGGKFTGVCDNLLCDTTTTTANYVAKWDPLTGWEPLGTGMNVNSDVKSLAWDGSTLYAGGEFTIAGGVDANRIAQWDGSSSWSALGTGTNNTVNALALDNNNNLFVGGAFTKTTVNGTMNYIAKISIDTTPDPFSSIWRGAFPLDQFVMIFYTGVTVTGINTAAPISIIDGWYSTPAGYTSDPGTISNGDVTYIFQNSSPYYYTERVTTLTIGGVSATYTTRTIDGDTDLDGIYDSIDTDDENDEIVDTSDNCIKHTNSNQLDVDGDGYGNICDADFNDDGIVDNLDQDIFAASFSQTGILETDLNGDGIVNSLDLDLFNALFGYPPGPSGVAP